MAMDLEVIRRILIEAKTTGVEQTTSQLKGLSTGYEGVTVASQKTEAATESVARKFAQLESRLDPASRAARTLAKDIATLDAQLAQTGNIERHGQLLEVATQNAIKMSGGAKAATGVMEGFKQTLSGVSGQLIGMAAGMGPVGIFLSALGPWGIAAAVGLNLVSSAIDKISETATTAGQKARSLVELSEATHLSIDELRGLKQAAYSAGVDEDKLESWLTKAAIAMEKAKTGSSELADALRAIDPAFLTSLQQAGSFAEKLDVLSRAAETAKAQGKDVTLFWRDVFGRGSGRADMVMQATQMAGGIAAVGNAMKNYGGSTEAEIRRRAELSEQNTKYQKQLDALNATLLQSTRVLELQNVTLQASVALKKQLVEVEKQLTDAGLSSAQAEAQATRDIASPQITQRAQDRNRYTGPARAPQEYGPPKPAGFRDVEADALALGKLQEKAIAASFAVDTLTAAQQKYNAEALKLSALGPAATSAEKMVAAQDKLKVSLEEGAFGAKDSAEALALYKRAMASVEVQGNALTAMHEAAIQTLRARTAAERQAAARSTVMASDATGDAEQRAQQAVTMEIEKQAQAHRDAMNAMEGQLQIAQAVTDAQKMAAQEAVTIRDLIREGRTEEQAAAEAAKQRQIAVAQVTSAAQAQLQTLRDQYAVSSAVTAAERMHAEAANATNALLRQNVDAYTAQAVGAQQLANAQAQANSAVEQQTHSLEQQLEVLKAQTQEEKNKILARQAYDNAVASGASPQAAAKLEDATKAVSDEQEKQQQQTAAIAQQREQQAEAEKQMIAYIQQQNLLYSGQVQLLDQMGFSQPGGEGQQGMQGGKTGRVLSPGGEYMLREKARQEALGKRVTVPQSWEDLNKGQVITFPGAGATFLVAEDTPESLFYERMGLRTPQQIEAYQRTQMQQQAQQQYAQQAVQPFEMQRLRAQIAGDKGAEISAVQGELGFYRGQPQTLENLQQIKSLQDALKQLTDATKDNTQSQNALSGLYSRQFGQGFYDGGAAVGELIYGLDNNTAGAIDDMQHANDNNTRNQNDLLTNLSQNQISSVNYMGGGIVSATNSVQGELRTGFSNVVLAVNTRAGSPTSPSGTTPTTTPSPIVPIYPHIPGTPGFARGGSFTTAGYGGDDSNVVAFRVSPQRERVTITPTNGGNAGGGNVNHIYNNDISVNIPQNTDEFRSSAMQVAEEIFNQVAVAGRRK